MAAKYRITCRHRRVHQTLLAHSIWRRGLNACVGTKQLHSPVSCCMAGRCARLHSSFRNLAAAAPVLLPSCMAGASACGRLWLMPARTWQYRLPLTSCKGSQLPRQTGMQGKCSLPCTASGLTACRPAAWLTAALGWTHSAGIVLSRWRPASCLPLPAAAGCPAEPSPELP